MPKRIIGVSAKLLDCAKKEFLEKGFLKASIRDIAKKADTSPRAIYTRFSDKEGLFSAIISSTIEEFMHIFEDFENEFWCNQSKSSDPPDFSPASMEGYLLLNDYIYAHADEFRLILKCSEGTSYSNFIEQLAGINCKHIEEHNKEENIPNFEAMIKLIHVLTHSFYVGLFEPFVHNMPAEESVFYIKKLCDFFSFGIKGIM